MVFLGLPVRAQLCNGSLGDPVAWISFGDGPGSGSPPLPASRTAYEYTGGGCPSPGRYTISNLSFGCFDQAWHTLVGDHTPNDAGGRYMLINSGNTQALVYQDTLGGLCGNTSYELSAWIINAFDTGNTILGSAAKSIPSNLVRDLADIWIGNGCCRSVICQVYLCTWQVRQTRPMGAKNEVIHNAICNRRS